MNPLEAVVELDLERVSTGVAGLDLILEGGLFRGGVYMLAAPPGSGKTILGSQIAFHHVESGGRAVFVTLLTESHARLIASIQHLAFFDLARVGDALKYLTAYEALAEGKLKGLLVVLKQIVRDHGATLLVIDGLVVAGSTGASDAEKKKFIHELQVYVELVGCTTLLLTGTNERSDDYAVRTMTDGLLELRQVRVGMTTARTLEVSKFRGSGVLMGAHAYEISDRGIDVYPRLESYLGRGLGQDAPLTGEGAKFGFPGFDEMLDGGLPAGSVTMLHGAPGSGKTLLGTSFLVAGARLGQRGLYFGFFETPRELAAKTDALGLPTSDLIAQGLLEIAWCAPFEALADKLAEKLFGIVRERKIERVFIDGVRGFSQSLVEPERARVFLAALANELRARGVVAVLAEEKHKLADDDLPEHGVASALENIIFLQHVKEGDRLHKVISIVKMRNAPQDPSVREFFIGPGGFSLARSATPATLTKIKAPRRRLPAPVAKVPAKARSRRR